MADDYQLSAEEHAQIRQEVARENLSGTSPSHKPRAIILAGQPGAGKSGLKKDAVNELQSDGGAVVVDTDELRAHHPDYRALTQMNDRTAAGHVQKDAGAWADGLTQDAMDGRRNLIIDGTLKNPENAKKLCRDLKSQGYDVDVRALAVAREDSMQGVYGRYEGQKAASGSGRWVPEAIHDQAYDGMPKSIHMIERGGYADRVAVYKRGADGPELIHEGRGASRALQRERDRERTAAELQARDRAWNAKADSPTDRDAGIMQRIEHRDPELSEPENRRAQEFAEAAKAKAAGKTDPDRPLWTKHAGAEDRGQKSTSDVGRKR